MAVAELKNIDQDSAILVVDDEDSIRSMLRLILESDGYIVLTASNGQEGLEILASTPQPSLIILDMMMPVMNGWQFYKAMCSDERYKKIPVVVTTAYSRQEIDLPEVELLRKPVDMDHLHDILKKYCNKTLKRP